MLSALVSMISVDCWKGRQQTGKNQSTAQLITGVICAHAVLYISSSCYKNPKLKTCLLFSVRWLGSKTSSLSLNTFLLKLADFPNLLPSLHPISDEREWDNVLEGSKHPNYYSCLPSVICLEGSYTFSWSLPAVKRKPLVPTLPPFPPTLKENWKHTQKAQHLNMWQPGWSAPNMWQEFIARNI